MASTSFQIQWQRPKKLQICIHGLPLLDGTSVLGIPPLKLSITLLRIFYFPFHRKNIFHPYVIHVPLIKHINNPFIAQVFKVMHILN